MARTDFINAYFEYVSDTEVPKIFHRWSIMSALGAYLGRQVVLPLGSFNIHPNQFVMLIGVPGTRKSTAIKLSKKLVQAAGYNTFSADKTSKEKFILDLADPEDNDGTDLLERTLFGGTKSSSEIYIACDEFNNFIGNGNVEFVSLLGEWWDYEGTYKYRIKSGKSVEIENPTINILGGNTSTGFSLAFPPQVIGQGFFSRLLLIYGEPTGKKITFPQKPSQAATDEMVSMLQSVKANVSGILTVAESAKKLLDKIYKSNTAIDDVRFEHYSNRRFTHLLKICMVVSASRMSTVIDDDDVVYANTILTHTEAMMPKALGEFGSGKYSEVTHKIISLLESAPRVFSQQDIWKQVNQDVDKINDLGNILMNLCVAEKIIRTDHGFIAKRKVATAIYNGVIDYSLLTLEEVGENQITLKGEKV